VAGVLRLNKTLAEQQDLCNVASSYSIQMSFSDDVFSSLQVHPWTEVCTKTPPYPGMQVNYMGSLVSGRWSISLAAAGCSYKVNIRH
jgi:hypothetical protein